MWIAIALSQPVAALADDAVADREGTSPPVVGEDRVSLQGAPPLEDGGYFELGLTLGGSRRAARQPDETSSRAIGLTSGFAWRRGALFAEARIGGFDGLNVGATLWRGRHWVLELLALHLNGNASLTLDFGPDPSETSSEADRKLLERERVTAGTGFRLSGFYGPVLTQLRLTSDWGEGLVASARLGRQGQLGNWNLHAIAGVRHTSASVSDEWWGVDRDEATERFGPHRATALTAIELELGAAYPLSRHWVLRGELRHRRHDGAILGSPLVERASDTFALASIVRAF